MSQHGAPCLQFVQGQCPNARLAAAWHKYLRVSSFNASCIDSLLSCIKHDWYDWLCQMPLSSQNEYIVLLQLFSNFAPFHDGKWFLICCTAVLECALCASDDLTVIWRGSSWVLWVKVERKVRAGDSPSPGRAESRDRVRRARSGEGQAE